MTFTISQIIISILTGINLFIGGMFVGYYMSIKEKQHAMRLLLNKVTIKDNEISIDIKI